MKSFAAFLILITAATAPVLSTPPSGRANQPASGATSQLVAAAAPPPTPGAPVPPPPGPVSQHGKQEGDAFSKAAEAIEKNIDEASGRIADFVTQTFVKRDPQTTEKIKASVKDWAKKDVAATERLFFVIGPDQKTSSSLKNLNPHAAENLKAFLRFRDPGQGMDMPVAQEYRILAEANQVDAFMKKLDAAADKVIQPRKTTGGKLQGQKHRENAPAVEGGHGGAGAATGYLPAATPPPYRAFKDEEIFGKNYYLPGDTNRALPISVRLGGLANEQDPVRSVSWAVGVRFRKTDAVRDRKTDEPTVYRIDELMSGKEKTFQYLSEDKKTYYVLKLKLEQEGPGRTRINVTDENGNRLVDANNQPMTLYVEQEKANLFRMAQGFPTIDRKDKDGKVIGEGEFVEAPQCFVECGHLFFAKNGDPNNPEIMGLFNQLKYDPACNCTVSMAKLNGKGMLDGEVGYMGGKCREGEKSFCHIQASSPNGPWMLVAGADHVAPKEGSDKDGGPGAHDSATTTPTRTPENPTGPTGETPPKGNDEVRSFNGTTEEYLERVSKALNSEVRDVPHVDGLKIMVVAKKDKLVNEFELFFPKDGKYKALSVQGVLACKDLKNSPCIKHEKGYYEFTTVQLQHKGDLVLWIDLSSNKEGSVNDQGHPEYWCAGPNANCEIAGQPQLYSIPDRGWMDDDEKFKLNPLPPYDVRKVTFRHVGVRWVQDPDSKAWNLKPAEYENLDLDESEDVWKRQLTAFLDEAPGHTNVVFPKTLSQRREQLIKYVAASMKAEAVDPSKVKESKRQLQISMSPPVSVANIEYVCVAYFSNPAYKNQIRKALFLHRTDPAKTGRNEDPSLLLINQDDPRDPSNGKIDPGKIEQCNQRTAEDR